MAQSRIDLDKILRSTLGSTNVYYDPPESFKLRYPCIVYSLSNHVDNNADDARYRRLKRYLVIYITQNADDPKVDELDDLRYCSLSRAYTSDGLFHYAYTIYY